MGHRFSFIALVVALAVLAHAGLYAAVAPIVPEPAMPNPGKAAGEPALVCPPVAACVIAGTLYCSEYGSRFRDTLMLVLTDGGDRHSSSISDTNGSFALPVPCGRSFELGIEFGDKAMPIGGIELPDSPEGTVYTLEIRHTGSYLELVRDVRNGIDEDDITYRLVPVGD